MLNLTKRQEQIIKTAIELISQGGIQNFSMRNLAEKLEISEPAIYRHFKNKSDVLYTILDYFENDSINLFEKIEKTELKYSEKIKQIFIGKCTQFKQNPEYARVLFAEEIFQNESQLSEKVKQIMTTNQIKLIQILEKALKNNELRKDIPLNHLTSIILGSLRLLVIRWRLLNFEFDIEKEAESLWESINKLIIKEK